MPALNIRRSLKTATPLTGLASTDSVPLRVPKFPDATTRMPALVVSRLPHSSMTSTLMAERTLPICAVPSGDDEMLSPKALCPVTCTFPVTSFLPATTWLPCEPAVKVKATPENPWHSVMASDWKVATPLLTIACSPVIAEGPVHVITMPLLDASSAPVLSRISTVTTGVKTPALMTEPLSPSRVKKDLMS